MAKPTNLFEYLDGTLTSPLFLAGAGLASGEGFGGAMQGMKMGLGAQEARQKQQQQQQLTQTLNDPTAFQGVPPEIMRLAQATRDPSALNSFLQKKHDPMGGLNRQLAEAKLKNLQQGGEAPSNVREWKYFNSLSPEDQQKYLRMKRAEHWRDTGTEWVLPNAANPTERSASIPKDIIGRETQEKVGAAQGAFIAAYPKLQMAQQSLEEKNKLVSGYIQDARKLVKESNWATGLSGALAKNVPGTPAFRLNNLIKTIKGNIGFDTLQQMRAESPTGGALGQVAVQELEYLQGVLGSLEQAQNAKDIDTILENIDNFMARSAERRRQALAIDMERFGSGGQTGQAPGAGARSATNLGAPGGPPAQGTAPQRFKYNPQTGELE